MRSYTLSTVLGSICVAVLCAILCAGLWPFHAPKNQVSWAEHRNGLSFGHYGTVLSIGEIATKPQTGGVGCSIEIWLQPARTMATRTILAFYTDQGPRIAFSLHQYQDSIIAQRELTQQVRVRIVRIGAEHILKKDRPAFITITSSAEGGRLYVDGSLAVVNPNFQLFDRDLATRLVVGNDPTSNDNWSGVLLGMAIYNRKMSASEVTQHYESWQTYASPNPHDDRIVAFYRFDERRGRVAHNLVRSSADLYIPERYVVPHAGFLKWPWTEFRPRWGYLKNVVINIAGFVPLGFFVAAYLSLERHYTHPRIPVATVILGALVSLTIEVLQAYLPTRDSGMTDIITNTFGTGMGALLQQSIFGERLLHNATRLIKQRHCY
jgi:VanZ like family/Concanavalin A-like lectin/glucanases superfamily